MSVSALMSRGENSQAINISSILMPWESWALGVADGHNGTSEWKTVARLKIT